MLAANQAQAWPCLRHREEFHFFDNRVYQDVSIALTRTGCVESLSYFFAYDLLTFNFRSKSPALSGRGRGVESLPLPLPMNC